MDKLIYRPKSESGDGEPSVMRRVGSSPEMDPSVEQNKNIAWVQGGPLIFFYISVLVLGRVICFMVDFDDILSWTALNVLHAIFTFPFLHWIKGVPFGGMDSDQGAYETLTWWEQLDSGAQFTKTKKTLTIVPIALYFIAIINCEVFGALFYLNTLVFVITIIAKLPFMHRVRLFHINK